MTQKCNVYSSGNVVPSVVNYTVWLREKQFGVFCTMSCGKFQRVIYLESRGFFLEWLQHLQSRSRRSSVAQFFCFTRLTSYANGLKNIKKPQKETPSRRVRDILRQVQKVMVPFPPHLKPFLSSPNYVLLTFVIFNHLQFESCDQSFWF